MKKLQKMLNLTANEWKWVLYDIGNSAFILLATAIVPIYFHTLTDAAGLSEAQYVTNWGYATSVATLIVFSWHRFAARWLTTMALKSRCSACACCWGQWAARRWARHGAG